MNFDPVTLWILSGLILLILEMLTGTFVLLFISFGSLAAGLIASIHSYSNQYALQILTCALISIIGVILLRKPIQSRLLKTNNVNTDLGKTIQVNQTIPPHGAARISYQGTDWTATNIDSAPLQQGDRATIVGIDGNMLLIKKTQ